MSRKEWSNETNRAFYQAMADKEMLPRFASTAGLSQCLDLDYMRRCGFFTAKVERSYVLEVGSGYGRCLQWLRDSGFKRLIGVEYASGFVELLREKFKADPAVNIKHQDIKNPDESFVGKFSLILWLWCGFCDFEKKEQTEVLSLLMSYLAKKGLLIIDVPLDTNATSTAGQEHTIELPVSGDGAPFPRYTGYVPNSAEIKGYATKVGVRVIVDPYTSETGRRRSLCVFFHPDRGEVPMTLGLRRKIYEESRAEYEKNRQHSQGEEGVRRFNVSV